MSKYTELKKNFLGIRSLLRHFFIYGDMSRSKSPDKTSVRSYDDDLRRIKSWLKDIIKSKSVDGEKRYSVCVDPSDVESNPFFETYKYKSFTDKDVNLHFLLLNILKKRELSVNEISDEICRLSGKAEYETNTIRNKLNEYVELGLLKLYKKNKNYYYKLEKTGINDLLKHNKHLMEAVKFFGSIAPIPIVSGYITDKTDLSEKSGISFRHQFLANCLDDIIIIDLLKAMQSDSFVEITNDSPNTHKITKNKLFPFKILVSLNTCRSYIMGYSTRFDNFSFFRIDYIKEVKILEKANEADNFKQAFSKALPYCYMLNMDKTRKIENFEMTLSIDEEKEKHILRKLKQETRGGTVEKTAPNTFVYKRKLYNTQEIMPWVKSFIGNIISIKGDNQKDIDCFYEDVEKMANIYE
ncbi:MAG: WYL domain-containing protein [Candidatus Riflebacteria bacterium]|nr:WYL domain-containing protein [Candidatus Riflebacteria bacterium]